MVTENLAVTFGPHRAVWDGWPCSVTRGTREWIKAARTAPIRARRVADAAGLKPAPSAEEPRGARSVEPGPVPGGRS